MANVSLRHISKRFGHVHAVRGLSLAVNDGEFVVLLGPSGAGKTTTLRLVTGLERPDAGAIFIDGRDVTRDPPGTRDIAFVFQQYSLYPHLTVYDNLAFPLRSPARRVPEPLIRKRVEQTAELLHITSKLANRATRLSGGEMQRVAIGRALVRDPSIYLMDEPLSSLDAKLRAELRLELKRIQLELGSTILYVTHDQVEAMTMASRIGVIRDGELLQIGTPREIYETPADRYVASRLGTPSINFLPAELLPHATMPAGAETLGIRTEHLRIAKADGGEFIGRIHRIEHLGDQNHVHLEYRNRMLVTLADPHRPLEAGQEVELQLMQPLYFDAAGRRITPTLHQDAIMPLDPQLLKSLVKAAAEQVIASTAELTALDQAIGDGDHGANMKRGFEAVLGKLDAIAAQPPDEALKTIGKTLVMTVGGASGPLYGSFFLAAGDALANKQLPGDLAEVFGTGVNAVSARGRSKPGEKTMLDVLFPVLETLKSEATSPDLIARVRVTAREATALTAPMQATKGRASFLGPRSIGHVDPGARSSCVLVHAVCDTLEACS